MIRFQPLRLEDRAVIERYTFAAGSSHCDLAFANMFCWQGVYHSAWAIVGDFLVIRFYIDGGSQQGYMQPVGAGDFTPILPLLDEDARAHGQRLRLYGLTDEGRDLIRRAFPEAYAFYPDRAAEDYIYRADDLRTLPGRRYQPKRNHINHFTALYPDYRYEELTPERFDECMALEQQWRSAHEQHTAQLPCRAGHEAANCRFDTRSHTATMCAEQRAMQLAFAHFDALGLRGGCIYAGERLVAFTYGSALNERTFDTHVEKADPEYVRDGAFTVINKCFAAHLPEQYEWIDREEDMGIDGLRRAKLSYHPAEVRHKYTAIRLDANEAACKSLWQTAFGDEEHFIDHFLLRYYDRQRMLTLKWEGKPAAMLHMLPFVEQTMGPMTYIYGVATAPTLRRRGLATRLLGEAIARLDACGQRAFLIPAPGDEALRRFYSRFGFEGTIPTRFCAPDGFDFGTGEPQSDLAMLRAPHGAGQTLPAQLTVAWDDGTIRLPDADFTEPD